MLWMIPVVIAGGMGGLIVALGLRKVRLRRAAVWSQAPRVRAPGGSPVGRRRLEKALRYWNALLPEKLDPPVFGGSPEAAPGEIVVVGRAKGMEANHAGETLTWHEDGAISRAEVRVPGDHLDADDPTLEHELGHALGLTHECVTRSGKTSVFGLPRGHVMSAELARAAWRADGVREALREGVA